MSFLRKCLPVFVSLVASISAVPGADKDFTPQFEA